MSGRPLQQSCSKNSRSISSSERDNLFLVFGWGLLDCGQLGCGALDRGLPPLYPRSIVVCGGLFRQASQTPPLAALGQATHRWNGVVLRLAACRVLRGQWEELTALERPSSRCQLAVACSGRDSPYRPRAVVASAGTSAGPALIKGSSRLRKRISIILEIQLTTSRGRDRLST